MTEIEQIKARIAEVKEALKAGLTRVAVDVKALQDQIAQTSKPISKEDLAAILGSLDGIKVDADNLDPIPDAPTV